MQLNKVIWLTGLSGAGKSTIAEQLKQKFIAENKKVFIVDGDQLRAQHQDLGFSSEDRKKQIGRAIDIAEQKFNEGYQVIVALISPFKEMRALARKTLGVENFVEVYVNTPLDICELRDTKGLYQKARAGLIKEMTGIDSVYEAPDAPDVTLNTKNQTVEESVGILWNFIKRLE